MKRKCKGFITSDSNMLYVFKKGELYPLGYVHESISITWPEKCQYEINEERITIWDSIGREILKTKLYYRNETGSSSELPV